MKYDFTSIIERHDRDALAVDAVGAEKTWGSEPDAPQEGFDFIPMWVADMNFATCPAVTGAIIERAKHPLFGYFRPKQAYFDSIISWQTDRHHVTGLTEEAIGYENGVHGCITSAVQALTQPGECILMHSPVYLGFKMDVDGLGRTAVYSPLKMDEQGIWRMDYEDMDAKIKQYHIHLAIFCSPHNPCGRVWEREELEKAMEVFEKNECFVISDEIWSDIFFTGHEHIPTQMVNDWARNHTVAVYAPSKTFNLAGLIGSYHIIYDPYLRDRVVKCGDNTHYNDMNVLSMYALMGAYSEEGREWTGELLSVLEGNASYAYGFIREHFPEIRVAMPQGTYMMFLDLTEYLERTGLTQDEVLKKGWKYGVGWQNGKAFEGPNCIRLNLASPRSRIEEAFDRMEKYIFLK